MTLQHFGKAVADGVESLKSNPSCLMGMVFGIVMAVLTYATLRAQQGEQHQREMALITSCVRADGDGVHRPVQ